MLSRFSTILILCLCNLAAAQLATAGVVRFPRAFSNSHAPAGHLANDGDRFRKTFATLEKAVNHTGNSPNLLEVKRAAIELSALKRHQMSDFVDEVRKLTAAGLGDKATKLQSFAQEYAGRLDAIAADLDQILAAPQRRKSEAEARLKSQILAASGEAPALLRSVSRAMNIPPNGQGPLAITNASGGARRLSPREVTDVPAPDDTAESKVVVLSPAIRAKAAELNNDPVRIYQFVRNKVEFEPYDGLMQNSESVLTTLRANSFDQSTLLIALFRAAGIPARYIGLYVRHSFEDAMNWTGAKEQNAAFAIIQASGPAGINADYIELNREGSRLMWTLEQDNDGSCLIPASS